VWMDQVEVSGPYLVEGETRWVASWEVTVENASLTRPYEFYPMFQIYALEVFDEEGASLREGWGPSARAAELAGLPPLELTEGATRLEPLTQRTVRVAVLIPAPSLYRMAYVLDPLDTESFAEMLDKNSLGSNVGVWINAYETECTNGEITPGPYVTEPPSSLTLRLARWPVDTIQISRGYGCDALFTGQLGSDCPDDQPWFHNGIDLVVPYGSPYYDTMPGPSRIDYAGIDSGGPDCSDMQGSQEPHTGYGNYVRQTGLIAGHVVSTWGAHLSGFETQTGQTLLPGGVLGAIGSTGCSTGAHLHFTVSVDYQTIDPLGVLP
jgi:murein DD-endopeptidase MepM/ murein hydrolase activator NlpD